MAVLTMPSFYPPDQYVVLIDGTLVVRDMYSCAREKNAVPVWAQDKDVDTYHD